MDSGNSTVKTPEPESETPTRITNGLLKRHPPPVTYKECLKNHAAALGAHALDGCGEFMPSPASDPSNPTSLKCAACGCHRNFHRRDPEDPAPDPPTAVPALEYHPHHRHHPPRVDSGSSPNDSPSPPPISSSYYPSAPHMLLALSHNNNNTPISIPAAANPSSSTRKRFRTKFSPYQKEKMLEISDRVGWKIQKRDEDVINAMCNEIGVDRGVFKVWMHNNKNTLAKKENPASPPAIAAAAIGNGAYRNIDGQVQETSRAHRDHLHGNTTADALGTNGSPSLS